MGWKAYQAHRAAEIERLEKHLQEEYARMPDTVYGFGAFVHKQPQKPSPEFAEWEKRVKPIEDRLEKLTGKRPERPPPRILEIL